MDKIIILDLNGSLSSQNYKAHLAKVDDFCYTSLYNQVSEIKDRVTFCKCYDSESTFLQQ